MGPQGGRRQHKKGKKKAGQVFSANRRLGRAGEGGRKMAGKKIEGTRRQDTETSSQGGGTKPTLNVTWRNA